MNDVLELETIKKKIAEYAQFSLGAFMVMETEPSFERLKIKTELARTAEAIEILRVNENPPFGGVYDVREAVDVAMKDALCNCRELMQCAALMRGCQNMRRYLHESNASVLDELGESLMIDLKLSEKIESCISNSYELYDHASVKLKSIRRSIAAVTGDIAAQTAKFIQANASKLTDTITTTRNDRVCVLVKNSEKNSIRGFIHGESASGATAYIEPEVLLQLNNRLQALKSSEEEEMKRILFELSQEVKKHGDALIANCETLALLDCIFAKAHYAHEIQGCVATLNDERHIYMKKARHPLIDPKKVVANTYEMKDHSILLITGSNTGGKSVTLKTIGLFVLMSYCGFPVSADEITIPKFDDIFIDIGDEQSIEQSLSTFSAHISKLAMITHKVSEHSLVILDELGSGTDPKEGEALAIAVLDDLRKKRCMVLATTHYSKLKSVSGKWPEVLCSSVEFDMEKMRPTYRYIEGMSGQSNALSIAAHFGLDPHIIEEARKIKEENETEDEKLIVRLNDLMNENLQMKEKLEFQSESLKEKEKNLLEKEKRFEEEREKMMESAQLEAQEIVEEAKERSDEILSEMRSKADAKVHELLEIRSQLNDLVEEEEKGPSDEVFHVGDSVMIKRYNYYGEVLEVKPKYLLVFANGMKMKLDPSDCTHTQKKKEKSVKKKAAVSSRTHTRASMECNVIGERVIDAISIVDKFLDTALANSLSSVRIIHGVGSGALRSAIWDYLKKNKYVESWRIGGEGEGGTGATVVTLKGGRHGK